MKEETKNVEVVEYTCDDGKVFKLDIESFLESLKKSAESHNKEYHTHFEYKNFVVDETLLEKYSSKNWKHFKFELVRKYIRNKQQNNNHYNRYGGFSGGTPFSIDEINNIDTEKKLLDIIRNSFDIDSKYDYSYQNLSLFKLLFGSGMFKITDCEWNLINMVNSNKLDLEATKYCIEVLGYDYDIDDILTITNKMIFKKNNFADTPISETTEIEYTNPLKRVSGSDEDIRKSKTIKYEQVIDDSVLKYLFENYKGDETELIKKILRSGNSLHYIYNFTKNNNFVKYLHTETFDNLYAFICFWDNKKCKYKSNDFLFTFYDGSWIMKEMFVKTGKNTIKKSFFEKFFYDNKLVYDTDSRKIESIIRLFSDYGYTDNETYFYLIDSLGINFEKYKYVDNTSSIFIKILQNLKDRDIFNNVSIWTYNKNSYFGNNTESLQELKNKYEGKYRLYRNEIYYIESIHYLKEKFIKKTSLHKNKEDIIESDYEYILDKEKIIVEEKKLRRMNYEDFCGYINDINIDEEKMRLQKEIDELQSKMEKL